MLRAGPADDDPAVENVPRSGSYRGSYTRASLSLLFLSLPFRVAGFLAVCWVGLSLAIAAAAVAFVEHTKTTTTLSRRSSCFLPPAFHSRLHIARERLYIFGLPVVFLDFLFNRFFFSVSFFFLFFSFHLFFGTIKNFFGSVSRVSFSERVREEVGWGARGSGKNNKS